MREAGHRAALWVLGLDIAVLASFWAIKGTEPSGDAALWVLYGVLGASVLIWLITLDIVWDATGRASRSTRNAMLDIARAPSRASELVREQATPATAPPPRASSTPEPAETSGASETNRASVREPVPASPRTPDAQLVAELRPLLDRGRRIREGLNNIVLSVLATTPEDWEGQVLDRLESAGRKDLADFFGAHVAGDYSLGLTWGFGPKKYRMDVLLGRLTKIVRDLDDPFR